MSSLIQKATMSTLVSNPVFCAPYLDQDWNRMGMVATMQKRSAPSRLYPIIPSQLAPEVENKFDKFRVYLNVSHFKPSEITVKTVEHEVVVEGCHYEFMDDHGSVSRRCSRRYHIPEDVDPKTVVALMNDDGILILEAPKKHMEFGAPATPTLAFPSSPLLSKRNLSSHKRIAVQKN